MPVPLSFSTTEVGRHQTTKSKMLEIVIATWATSANSPKLVISVDPNKLSVLIINLIPAIRTMTKKPETYRQLAWRLLGTLPKGYHLFADTYQEVSIKNCKRLDRGTSVRLMINSPASKVPSDFTKFMKCCDNKTCLINLICKVVSNDCKRALALLKHNKFYFSKEDKWYSKCITSEI